MPDQNELLRRFAASSGDPQAVERLRQALSTPEGRRAAQIISAQNADALERAAAAAQRGDMREAARLAQSLMQTHEGAALAAHFRRIFGQGGNKNG